MAERRAVPTKPLKGELKDEQIATKYPHRVVEALRERRDNLRVPVAVQIRDAVIASLHGSLAPGDSDVAPVPVMGAIHAGEATGQEQLDEIKHIVCSELPTGKAFMYLAIEGDSMNRQVPPGAMALVEGGKLPRDGQTVAVRLVYPDHTEFTLKVYHSQSGAVYLEPDSSNPEHKTLVQADTRPPDLGPDCIWLDPAEVTVLFDGVFTGAYIAKPGVGVPVVDKPKKRKTRAKAPKLPGVEGEIKGGK